VESTARKTAIIQLRKQLHISQAKLGQAIDLSQSTVSAWESGYTELPEATVVEMGNYLIDEQAKLAAIAFPKFNTPVEVAWMDSTFEWEDELAEMMQQWAAELPNLTAQVDIDRAEAQKGTTNGIDLTPIFAQIESFMYRIAKLERQNLEFETRIAELEAARHAPPSSRGSQ
jgi:transcriptional regulator with XRE-family HTH domain